MAVALLEKAKEYLQGVATAPPKTRALMALFSAVDWYFRYRKHQVNSLDKVEAEALLKAIDPQEPLKTALEYLECAISLGHAKAKEKA